MSESRPETESYRRLGCLLVDHIADMLGLNIATWRLDSAGWELEAQYEGRTEQWSD